MQDSKFYKWISLLPTQEQNDFLRYVEHAGGKNRQELHSLLSHFLEHIVRGKGLDREAFYQKWRGDVTFDANYLRKRLTRLQELLGSFLAAQELALSPAHEAVYLAKALERRGWGQFIEAEHRDGRKVIQAAPQDDQTLWQLLQLENAYLNMKLPTTRNFAHPALQVPLQLIEEHYLVQALRYACAARNLDRIFDVRHDYGLLPHFLPLIAARLPEMNPMVRIYYLVHQMHEDQVSNRHFEALLAELSANASTFTTAIQRELYQYALNYCIAHLNAGDMAYAQRLAPLYLDALKSGILLRNGFLPGDELKNIIGLTVRFGQWEAAENILTHYGPLLSLDTDPAVLNYCKAVILYAKAEYSAARRECETVLRDTRDPFYEIDARMYHWRASYELKDFEFVESQYDAFRMYLTRAKSLGKTRIERYSKFVKYFFRLHRILRDKLDPAAAKVALEALAADIDKDGNVTDAGWLKDKITQALRGL
jgi:hypothetical protein